MFLITALICVLLVLFMNGEDGTGVDSSEGRMEKILSSIEGAGRVNIMIAGEVGAAHGAVVAAEGADDMRVYLELLRAVRALTGLESNCIEIIKSSG